MTTVAAAPVRARHRHERPAPSTSASRRAAVRLQVRLIRRGAGLLAIAIAAYLALEVASYSLAYPDGVPATQFAMFEDNPAIRMLQGVPSALDTAGGFALWDCGWIVALIASVWALLTTSRLLRGEEDAQRADLVLAGPVRPAWATGTALAVVCGGALAVGTAGAAALALSGTAWWPSLLSGSALAGTTATFAAITAVVAQLVDVRRRVAAVSAGILGALYVVRMVGNSDDARLWLRWLSPLAWLEVLDPYGTADLRVLLALVLVPVALGALAVRLRTRRDTGAALLAREDVGRARLRGLGSTTAFAWRSGRGALLAWVAGLGALAVVVGALVATMVEWLAQDPQYRELARLYGYEDLLAVDGFVAVMASMLVLAVTLQVSWRVGAARTEEEAGHLEQLLARPVPRWRWLAGHTLLALLSALALLVLMGVGVWAGVATSGSAVLDAADSLRAVLNGLPVVVLVWGLGVLTYGAAPRLTVAVPVTLSVVGYVLTMLAPALRCPGWVADLSPWTHLALVPLQDFAATAGIAMTVLGIALAVVGVAAFQRRDVVGA